MTEPGDDKLGELLTGVHRILSLLGDEPARSCGSPDSPLLDQRS
jgi:hypothetical protein